MFILDLNSKRKSIAYDNNVNTSNTFSFCRNYCVYYTMHQIPSVFPFFSRAMMLILIYSISGVAGNTFILKGYIDSISTELDEAAKNGRCLNIQVYRLIILPIVVSMIAIIALWSFIDHLWIIYYHQHY